MLVSDEPLLFDEWKPLTAICCGSGGGSDAGGGGSEGGGVGGGSGGDTGGGSAGDTSGGATGGSADTGGATGAESGGGPSDTAGSGGPADTGGATGAESGGPADTGAAGPADTGAAGPADVGGGFGGGFGGFGGSETGAVGGQGAPGESDPSGSFGGVGGILGGGFGNLGGPDPSTSEDPSTIEGSFNQAMGVLAASPTTASTPATVAQATVANANTGVNMATGDIPAATAALAALGGWEPGQSNMTAATQAAVSSMSLSDLAAFAGQFGSSTTGVFGDPGQITGNEVSQNAAVAFGPPPIFQSPAGVGSTPADASTPADVTTTEAAPVAEFTQQAGGAPSEAAQPEQAQTPSETQAAAAEPSTSASPAEAQSPVDIASSQDQSSGAPQGTETATPASSEAGPPPSEGSALAGLFGALGSGQVAGGGDENWPSNVIPSESNIVNPDAWDAAVAGWPASSNVEDRTQEDASKMGVEGVLADRAANEMWGSVDQQALMEARIGGPSALTGALGGPDITPNPAPQGEPPTPDVLNGPNNELQQGPGSQAFAGGTGESTMAVTPADLERTALENTAGAASPESPAAQNEQTDTAGPSSETSTETAAAEEPTQGEQVSPTDADYHQTAAEAQDLANSGLSPSDDKTVNEGDKTDQTDQIDEAIAQALGITPAEARAARGSSSQVMANWAQNARDVRNANFELNNVRVTTFSTDPRSQTDWSKVDKGDKPGSAAILGLLGITKGSPEAKQFDALQGISLPTKESLGQVFVVTAPNGEVRTLQQTDVGPSARHGGTGVLMDMSAAAAQQFGFDNRGQFNEHGWSSRPATTEETQAWMSTAQPLQIAGMQNSLVAAFGPNAVSPQQIQVAGGPPGSITTPGGGIGGDIGREQPAAMETAPPQETQGPSQNMEIPPAGPSQDMQQQPIDTFSDRFGSLPPAEQFASTPAWGAAGFPSSALTDQQVYDSVISGLPALGGPNDQPAAPDTFSDRFGGFPTLPQSQTGGESVQPGQEAPGERFGVPMWAMGEQRQGTTGGFPEGPLIQAAGLPAEGLQGYPVGQVERGGELPPAMAADVFNERFGNLPPASDVINPAISGPSLGPSNADNIITSQELGPAQPGVEPMQGEGVPFPGVGGLGPSAMPGMSGLVNPMTAGVTSGEFPPSPLAGERPGVTGATDAQTETPPSEEEQQQVFTPPDLIAGPKPPGTPLSPVQIFDKIEQRVQSRLSAEDRAQAQKFAGYATNQMKQDLLAGRISPLDFMVKVANREPGIMITRTPEMIQQHASDKLATLTAGVNEARGIIAQQQAAQQGFQSARGEFEGRMAATPEMMTAVNAPREAPTIMPAAPEPQPQPEEAPLPMVPGEPPDMRPPTAPGGINEFGPPIPPIAEPAPTAPQALVAPGAPPAPPSEAQPGAPSLPPGVPGAQPGQPMPGALAGLPTQAEVSYFMDNHPEEVQQIAMALRVPLMTAATILAAQSHGVPSMAEGGYATGPTLVGERGPEVFTPNRPGTITPLPMPDPRFPTAGPQNPHTLGALPGSLGLGDISNAPAWGSLPQVQQDRFREWQKEPGFLQRDPYEPNWRGSEDQMGELVKPGPWDEWMAGLTESSPLRIEDIRTAAEREYDNDLMRKRNRHTPNKGDRLR